ncbi:MAG: type II secretion system F family protein [Oscillospiraceae bacterium]|nr:type II secretion system F family protein [Oscillospiraceae bacterium]
MITSILFPQTSTVGQKQIRQLRKWKTGGQSMWTIPALRKAVDFFAQFVLMDPVSEADLRRNLQRAGMKVSPQQFASRKYVIIAFAVCSIAFFSLINFIPGTFFALVFAVYLFLDERSSLNKKIKERYEAIESEMPRFIRTVCRNLHSNRDVYAIIESYYKVAGPIMKEELDILLSHMRTGGITSALQAFQVRLGTDEAFRLCSALIEMERGIDQIATLEHLADDMARKTKQDLQKLLASRPKELRTTYLPAIGVSILMVFYVLGSYLLTLLDNIW